MRFKEILNEKIATPPRNLPHYLRQRMKDVAWCMSELRAAEEMVAQNEREGEDMLVRFLRYGTDYADAADDVHVLISLCGRGYDDRARLERYLPLEDLHRNIESYLTHGPQFFGYLQRAFQYADAIEARARAVMAVLPTAEAGAKQYGYDEHAEKDEEYHAAMGLLKGLRRLVTVIERAEAVWADLKPKLDVIAAKQAAAYTGKYRPEHEEIETLYHASIHASELASEGFKAEKPEGRTGVGNFGTQSTISFTHDYKIAQDIVRCLKEFWMIAHGEVTARTVIGWMDAEGIDYKDPKFLSSLGLGVDEQHEVQGYVYTRTRQKQAHEVRDPQEIAKLYNVYLWHTKLRQNPVFANLDGLVAQMATIQQKDIGIVACQVRLTQDDEYLEGEREFRVAPDRVISIKRIV